MQSPTTIRITRKSCQEYIGENLGNPSRLNITLR